jgi:hypothetical protein
VIPVGRDEVGAVRHAKAAKPFLMLSSVFEIPLIQAKFEVS